MSDAMRGLDLVLVRTSSQLSGRLLGQVSSASQESVGSSPREPHPLIMDVLSHSSSSREKKRVPAWLRLE
jgi:hypothetical protein